LQIGDGATFYHPELSGLNRITTLQPCIPKNIGTQYKHFTGSIANLFVGRSSSHQAICIQLVINSTLKFTLAFNAPKLSIWFPLLH
jgi:hypothetical protein